MDRAMQLWKAEESQADWFGKIHLHTITWKNSGQDSCAQFWIKIVFHIQQTLSNRQRNTFLKKPDGLHPKTAHFYQKVQLLDLH